MLQAASRRHRAAAEMLLYFLALVDAQVLAVAHKRLWLAFSCVEFRFLVAYKATLGISFSVHTFYSMCSIVFPDWIHFINRQVIL